MTAPNGQLTLLNLQTFVKDFVNGAGLPRCGRAANLVLKQIHRRFSAVERSTVTATPQYITGTVTVTQNFTTLTGSGTNWTSLYNGGVIRISGDYTWYTVTVTGTGAITLSSAFKGASGSGLSYSLINPFVTFPSQVEEVVRMWESGKTPLRFASDEHRGIVELALTSSPGRPVWFVPTRIDTTATPNDSLKYLLVPFPDSTIYTYEYSYKRRPTYFDPSGDGSDTSGLPSIFDDAIMYGTLWMIWDQEDKQDRSQYWKGLYEQALRDITAHQSQNFDVVRDDPFGGDGGLWTYENRPFV